MKKNDIENDDVLDSRKMSLSLTFPSSQDGTRFPKKMALISQTWSMMPVKGTPYFTFEMITETSSRPDDQGNARYFLIVKEAIGETSGRGRIEISSMTEIASSPCAHFSLSEVLIDGGENFQNSREFQIVSAHTLEKLVVSSGQKSISLENSIGVSHSEAAKFQLHAL